MSKQCIGVVVGFLGIFLAFFYPLLSHFQTHTTSVNDGVLIVWFVHQSAAAWSGTGEWYHWPFFHPYTYTSTYSDPFVTAGALLIFIKNFISNPVAQYNSLLIFSTVTNFAGMFILGKALWKKNLAAFIAAAVFAFSYTQYQFIPHLHSYMLAGIPFGAWSLIRYLETAQKKYAILFGFFLAAQTLNAPMTGYFLLAIMSAYLVSESLVTRFFKDHFLLSVNSISMAICIWYYLPYVVTAQTLNVARTIRDTAHFSYPLEKLLQWDIAATLVLLFAGNKWLQKNKLDATQSMPSKIKLRTVVAIIVVGAVCMLGPVIKIGSESLKIDGLAIPLPYAAFYYLVPGIQAFRAVSRWAVVLNFGLALGLGWLAARALIPQKWLVLALTGYLAVTLYFVRTHQHLYSVDLSIPPIYAAVKDSDQQILAELPIYQWDMGELAGSENKRLLLQLYHQKKLYNGVSGITPPQRNQDIHTHFQNFPGELSLEVLETAGVELIVVHFDEYAELHKSNLIYSGIPSKNPKILKDELRQNGELELVGCSIAPEDCLYLLRK